MFLVFSFDPILKDHRLFPLYKDFEFTKMKFIVYRTQLRQYVQFIIIGKGVCVYEVRLSSQVMVRRQHDRHLLVRSSLIRGIATIPY